MSATTELPPRWFSDAGSVVWQLLPAVTFLADEYADEALGTAYQADLLQGTAEDLRDIDEDSRFDAAYRVVGNACTEAGVRMQNGSPDLPPAEFAALLRVVHERDAAPKLVDEWVRTTGVVTVGFPTPQGDASAMLAFLGVPGNSIVRNPTPDHRPLTSRDAPYVLCPMNAADLLSLEAAPGTHLATLQVGLVGVGANEDGYTAASPVPATPGASLLIRVDELRNEGWLVSDADEKQAVLAHGIPNRVAGITLEAPPEGPVHGTYESLRADGWTTRAALAAANALHIEP